MCENAKWCRSVESTDSTSKVMSGVMILRPILEADHSKLYRAIFEGYMFRAIFVELYKELIFQGL